MQKLLNGLSSLIAGPGALPTASPNWPPPGPRAVTPRVARWLTRLWSPRSALAAILLVAAVFRLLGLNWDAGHHLHPDERFITMVAERVRIPSSVDEFFDTARSPLNPYNKDFGSYIYGTAPLFFVRTLAEGIQGAANAISPAEGPLGDFFKGWRTATSYGEVTLLGRVVSAMADVLTVLLVFLIGRRLYGPAIGLLAALLSSLTVVQIQAAHFFTTESPLNLATTLAFYAAIRASSSNSLRWWALLGVATGLAASSKITALFLGVVILAAAWVLWYRSLRLGLDPDGIHRVPASRGGPAERWPRRYVWEDLAVALGVAGILAFITFRLAQPYAFSGPGVFGLAPNPKFLADLDFWQRVGTGQADYPPSHQWAGTTPYLWQLMNMALWGMGPPLFAAAWLGCALAAFQLVRDPARWHGHLLGLAWIGINFLYWGPQLAKPMRYLLPIYPQLTIFAAFFLVSAWRWATPAQGPLTQPSPPGGGEGNARIRVRGAPLFRPAVTVAIAVVVAWTAFYALAFASIYTRPTTRVAASEWIYQNVPAGSRMGLEHWDDPLPLGIGGRSASSYRGIEFPMYGEDTPDKRSQLLDKLDEADYIVLSSNRLYGAIPKLPQRYPMTARYYRALLSGELGFEPVAEFNSRPSFLGIELNDDNAEELFTVYEHPKVTILEKGPGYSSERTRGILADASLDLAIKGLKPIHARTGGLLLDPGERAAAQAGGTWSDIFDPESLPNQVPLLVWYVTLQALAVLAFPVVWLLCRGLADRGYALAKVVGLLAAAYVPWLLASLQLVPYTRLSILLGMILLGASSAAVLVRHRAAFVTFVSQRRWLLVAAEGLFGAIFLLFLGIRAANPDLWHSAYGGEKPMDFAYLNAIIRTTWFPPYDPWLTGGYINYYYFGQVIVASLVKLTGIVPWVGYNLAIPTMAALTASSAASVTFNLLVGKTAGPGPRQTWAFGGGVLAAFFVTIAGNLQGAGQLLSWVSRLGGEPINSVIPGLGLAVSTARGIPSGLGSLLTGQGLPPLNFDFWASTRVIGPEAVTPITEFPFFTFLYGDLHAHMIAMPVALLVLALAVNLVRIPTVIHTLLPLALTLALAAIALGVLRMTNTWDYPTYLLLLGAGLLIGQLRTSVSAPIALRRAAFQGAVILVGSNLAVFPFLARYEQFYTGLELHPFHTSLTHYLTIMGCFLGALAAYLAFQAVALRARLARAGANLFFRLAAPTVMPSAIATPMRLTTIPRAEGAAVLVGIGALGTAGATALAGVPVVGVGVAGIAALGLVAALRRPAPATLFLYALAAAALGLTAAVEVVVVKGDISRMNTVFKFYLQAWVLLSIASAAMLAVLARRLVGSRWLWRGYRRWIGVGLAVLIAATLVYPLLGTPSKLQHRFVPLPPSLDGMAFMSQARYEDNGKDLLLADDFAAIRWMLTNLDGTPVIAEGTAPLYHWGSRVSIYTGLPTIVGWDWHQRQQRGDFGTMVEDRARDVAQIFGPASPETTLALLRKYGVQYVYVGGLERAFYSPQALGKFERMVPFSLERAYSGGAVTIYRVR